MEPKWHIDWPEWISVEDEMPPAYGGSGDGKSGNSLPVLCFVAEPRLKYAKGIIRTGWYDFYQQVWKVEGMTDGVIVTHWIPLPKPPTAR